MRGTVSHVKYLRRVIMLFRKKEMSRTVQLFISSVKTFQFVIYNVFFKSVFVLDDVRAKKWMTWWVKSLDHL